MFNYLFITNVPEVASFAESSGVSRIFVDLEINGKEERQGHLDTVISRHDFSDIRKIKDVLSSAELLVRLNPLYRHSKTEVNKAIDAGADIIMLPMFRTVEEVFEFGNMIDGRAKFIPLIETKEAAELAYQICRLDCVTEVHIGLNDLHLDLGLSFMFELLSNGYVDNIVSQLNKPYGIGGIARYGEGMIPGEMVMIEHIRLKSSAVILSRTFHRRSRSLKKLKEQVDLPYEIRKLENFRKKNVLVSQQELLEKHSKFITIVDQIIN